MLLFRRLDSLWVPAETANERVRWPVFFPYLFNVTYVDFDHNSLAFCLVKGREKVNVLSFFQSAIGLAASCPVFGCRPSFSSRYVLADNHRYPNSKSGAGIGDQEAISPQFDDWMTKTILRVKRSKKHFPHYLNRLKNRLS